MLGYPEISILAIVVSIATFVVFVKTYYSMFLKPKPNDLDVEHKEVPRAMIFAINKFILEKSVFGTPIFKLGHGENKLLILSGIHGNELPSQIANIRLLNELVDKKINGTVFFIPFAAPKATMENKRLFNTLDLNRASHVKNSLSNLMTSGLTIPPHSHLGIPSHRFPMFFAVWF